jgi:hypothetical protein
VSLASTRDGSNAALSQKHCCSPRSAFSLSSVVTMSAPMPWSHDTVSPQLGLWPCGGAAQSGQGGGVLGKVLCVDETNRQARRAAHQQRSSTCRE